MKQLGLIGKNISYSFSPSYFKSKFEDLNLDENWNYTTFDLQDIEKVEAVFLQKNLIGFNVTIPYKKDIIAYLDHLDPIAKQVNAVNTVAIVNGKKVGYNTDVIGFEQSILPLLKPSDTHALILGTGGASMAIRYALERLGLSVMQVSRSQKTATISYEQLDAGVMQTYSVIVNCTPLGTHPNVDDLPLIPYSLLTNNHLLYDLIYNPEETRFLNNGKQYNCRIKNGLEMLELQADAAWDIWSKL